jgi:hypothetical protein
MLSDNAISVLTRPLPKDKIKQRPGKGGMTFNYVSPDFVIDLLNEAFGYAWSNKIVSKEDRDGTIIVQMELTVPGADGTPVTKSHYGSCEITKGLDVGDAHKGAASDAMKKCATLLGLGLELYKDEEVTGGGSSFTPPKNNVPRPPAAPPQRVASPAATAPAFRPPAPPAAPVSKASSPFAEPKANALPRPQVPTPPKAPAKPAVNPFQNKNAVAATGPTSTQLNSLTNIATRKGLQQAELISMAGVVDDHGNPIELFENLSHSQAIAVIRAAQNS